VEGQKAGFTALEAELLARRYGSNVPRLYHLAEEAKEMSSKYSLPLLTAVQLLYGIREEMVLRPSDFFVRRTGDLYFRIAEVKAGMEAVIRYMSDCFGWDGEKRELYRQELQQLLEEACPFSQPL
jgi:glycerol-3-phosphate dehydrogenase